MAGVNGDEATNTPQVTYVEVDGLTYRINLASHGERFVKSNS